MKNLEKYKTAKERHDAFKDFCEGKPCMDCELDSERFELGCCFHWLELEAEEEKPLPCPFCGEEVVIGETSHGGQKSLHQVWCKNFKQCDYNGAKKGTALEAIAAHNRVAKAVMESKKEVE